MEYYFSKTLHVSFDEAITITTEGLKSQGFGVITKYVVKKPNRIHI